MRTFAQELHPEAGLANPFGVARRGKDPREKKRAEK